MHYLYNLIVIRGEHRAGLKGRGARGNFFSGGLLWRNSWRHRL